MCIFAGPGTLNGLPEEGHYLPPSRFLCVFFCCIGVLPSTVLLRTFCVLSSSSECAPGLTIYYEVTLVPATSGFSSKWARCTIYNAISRDGRLWNIVHFPHDRLHTAIYATRVLFQPHTSRHPNACPGAYICPGGCAKKSSTDMSLSRFVLSPSR